MSESPSVCEILHGLFRKERKKIMNELRYLFTIDIEMIEDVVSDTFLTATEYWKRRGLPENPKAWLHAVAKNKTRNYLKKKAIFDKKLSPELKLTPVTEEIEIDISKKTIDDSQLAMMFTICNPCLSKEAQVGLVLNLLCGLGVQEIADAFLTTKHVIYKRLERAKERLKINNVRIEPPTTSEVKDRLDSVLTSMYLLFSEGHYSLSHDTSLRENLCAEAMRLNQLLVDNPLTNTPAVHALFALMCFHSSRFATRSVPYDQQDEELWNPELIAKGSFHLNVAATGEHISKFHLEAGIAYWHTRKEDTITKWENILGLYDKLLDVEYSPIAALNRTYALARVKGKKEAMDEAKNLDLAENHFYQWLVNFLEDTKISDINLSNDEELVVQLNV